MKEVAESHHHLCSQSFCGTSKWQHKCQLQNYKQQWVLEENIWQSQKGQRPACLMPFFLIKFFLIIAPWPSTYVSYLREN